MTGNHLASSDIVKHFLVEWRVSWKEKPRTDDISKQNRQTVQLSGDGKFEEHNKLHVKRHCRWTYVKKKIVTGRTNSSQIFIRVFGRTLKVDINKIRRSNEVTVLKSYFLWCCCVWIGSSLNITFEIFVSFLVVFFFPRFSTFRWRRNRVTSKENVMN